MWLESKFQNCVLLGQRLLFQKIYALNTITVENSAREVKSNMNGGWRLLCMKKDVYTVVK